MLLRVSIADKSASMKNVRLAQLYTTLEKYAPQMARPSSSPKVTEI
jgi:hypothetical protein